MDTQLPGSAPPFAAPSSARPANGLGVAALVLGVASLVAAVSFVLFPLALPGGLLAAILGSIAVSRGRTSGATNHGQAIAGIVCGILALVGVFAARFGTFAANNTSVFTSFDNCIAKVGDRSAVANCIAASRTTSGHRVLRPRPDALVLLRSEPTPRPGSSRALTASG